MYGQMGWGSDNPLEKADNNSCQPDQSVTSHRTEAEVWQRFATKWAIVFTIPSQ
jgi:hypothetical protein